MPRDRVGFQIINYNNTLESLACGQNSDRNMVIFQFDFILQNFVRNQYFVRILSDMFHVDSI